MGLYGFVVTVPGHSIRIFNGCEVRSENAYTRVTVRHHETCEWCRTVIPTDGIFNLHSTNIVWQPQASKRHLVATFDASAHSLGSRIVQAIDRNPSQSDCQMLKLYYPSMCICNFPMEIPARTIQKYTWKKLKSFDLWFRTLDRQDTVDICMIDV